MAAEKTAQMLMDKHQDGILKAFNLWPFGNLGQNRKSSSHATRGFETSVGHGMLCPHAASQLISRAIKNAAAAASPPTSTVCTPPRRGFTPV